MPGKAEIRLESGFSEAEQSPGYLLWKAANLLQRSHASTLKALALTPAQFSLMTCLVFLAQSGAVTSARIARHAGMDKMMVSDLVRTLEKKRLLETGPNPEDGRSFVLRPTRAGVRATNAAVREVERIDDEFFRAAEVTPAFAENLRRIVAAHAAG